MYSLGIYKISSTKSIYSQKKKALGIMNFAPFNAHTTPLFKNCNILKFADIIDVESCIFINNCFNKDSFSIFSENFQPRTHAILDQLEMLYYLSYNTVRFGRKSTTLTWNYLQDKLTEYSFLCLIPRKLNILLVKFFISEYNS